MRNDRKARSPEDDASEEDGLTLDREISIKYDPAVLSRLVMRDAGRGEPLDAHTRSLMERKLGGDFSSVRIFRGPLAEEITARYRADAVTIGGTDMILVRESWRGSFQTTAGKALLAHELTHVKQQQRGMHFALSQGGQEGDIEAEAEQVESRVYAEEQGRDFEKEEQERKEWWERKVMDIIRKEVHRWREERRERHRERTGAFELK